MRKYLTIGIFGFGCVGQGLYDVLSRTNGMKASIKRICIKDATKERSLAPSLFTTNRNELLYDDEIDVIVELINDEAAAFDIVKTAMQNGKSVVSASKKMIANHLTELVRLQELYGVSFLYEGACCASIPIIRNLEEYYDNDLLHSVSGIFNGSTNYILTKIFEDGQSYQNALRKAQELGFAETDPSMDVEGFDPKYKLCILMFHAFGIYTKPEKIYNLGISRINDFDIHYAAEKKATIKLVAACRKINDRVTGYVLPHLVANESQLSSVRHEYNAVIVESAFSDQQFFTGKGAGSTPTGSAVLSDISALSYGYKYEYKKSKQVYPEFSLKTQYQLEESSALSEQNEEEYSSLNDDHQLVELQFTNCIHLRVYVRFRHDADIEQDDFLTIYERYISESAKYIVGSINLETLQAATWTKNPELCIIVLG